MFPSTLLLAAASTAQACLFQIQISQTKSNFGGSNVVACEFRAYLDDDADLYNDTPDAYAEVECAGGDATLSINDNDWTLSMDGTATDLDLGGEATISGLSDETIFPDGEEDTSVDEDPVSSVRYHDYWISGVTC